MTIYHAADHTFRSDLKKEGLTLVNFWATWCGPCRMFAPTLEAFDSENSEIVKTLKVNVDKCEETAAQFGVMSIPTTILFKNGKPVDKEVGIMTKAGLKQFIARHQ